MLGLLALAAGPLAGTAKAAAGSQTVTGRVEGDGAPLSDYVVTLYRTTRGASDTLRQARTGADGGFEISYRPGSDRSSVFYLIASQRSVTLATVLGSQAMPALPNQPDAVAAASRTTPGEAPAGDLPDHVVINERTTVATAYALAQFIDGTGVSGNAVGVRNAAAMVGNMVDVTTGEIAPVLAGDPNGSATSTLPTFNALADMVAGCIADPSTCTTLFEAAPSPDGQPTRGTLQAIVDIARNPWRNVAALFGVAALSDAFQPALAAAPDAWTIALKFRGNGLLNGPGNFAFDAEGTSWLINNYTPPSNDPTIDACDGKLLFRFTPTGQFFPGSPYQGGGISGAGYGITFDPQGRLWVGNFGFASPVCASSPQGPTNDSMSLFRPDGTALSPASGFTQGQISWPQGTVSDQKGNIWIANCGNSSVTIYPKGDPFEARNIPQGVLGLSKPFGIAIDHRGFAWVTGNNSNSVAIIGKGRIRNVSGVFDRPMAIAGDSRGNMWVANSHIVDVPCPSGGPDTNGQGGSIVLIRSNGEDRRRGTLHRRRPHRPLGHRGRRQRQCLGGQFRQREGHRRLRPRPDQPVLRHGHEPVPARPADRRPDLAAHRLHERRAAAHDRDPDRPLGQCLGHRQLEEGADPEQSGRRRDRHLRRHRRAGEGPADRTARAAVTAGRRENGDGTGANGRQEGQVFLFFVVEGIGARGRRGSAGRRHRPAASPSDRATAPRARRFVPGRSLVG